MADSIAQDTANLHLDDVTGERVSKSELKKRQKQRQQDEKKKEKAAAAPQQPAAKKKEAEVELTPNVSTAALESVIASTSNLCFAIVCCGTLSSMLFK